MNAELVVYKAIAELARLLPPPAMAGLCRGVTAAIPMFDAERKRLVIRHLGRSMGRPLRPDEVGPAVRAVFATYARYYTETARLPGLSQAEVDRSFSYEGFAGIEDGVAAGKGTILVLPHLGGWEWAGSWLARVPGFDVVAVVEPLENEGVRQFMHEWRESVGLHVLPLAKGLGGELLSRLRANQIVCLMSDRNIGDGGVAVDFFGERTELPGGPATLALRTGATIVPLAVYHRGRFNHAVVEPPLVVERQGRLRDDVTRVTQDIADILEMQIRREPTQWLLLQPNWPSDAANGPGGDS